MKTVTSDYNKKKVEDEENFEKQIMVEELGVIESEGDSQVSVKEVLKKRNIINMNYVYLYLLVS